MTWLMSSAGSASMMPREENQRQMFRQSPEVVTIVSQLGRPDDGTDPTSFFNAA